MLAVDTAYGRWMSRSESNGPHSHRSRRRHSHGLRFGPEPEGMGKGQTSQHTAVGSGRSGRTPHSR